MMVLREHFPDVKQAVNVDCNYPLDKMKKVRREIQWNFWQ